MADEITPITREETYLNAISEGGETGMTPITREEMYLSAIAGESDLPADMTPITRREMYLQKIYDNGGAGGGGEAEGTVEINITQNGTITRNVARYASAEITTNVPNSYEASDEGKVVSNGALASQTSRNVTANGIYDTTVNDEVVVNVPNPSTGTKQITTNGTHDVTDYASAQVNVPNSYSASDEGKVVSNGALVSQTSRQITANGTVDTTLNDEVVVNVPTGITPTGSQTFTQNGTYDVSALAEAVVNVASGGSSIIQEFTYTHAEDWITDATGTLSAFETLYLNKGNGFYWYTISGNDTTSIYSAEKGWFVNLNETRRGGKRKNNWAGNPTSSFYLTAGSIIHGFYIAESDMYGE